MWQLNLNVTCQHFVLFSFCTSYIKYFSQNCIKQIIFFNLGYIYHFYLIHISEVNELHERHKRIKSKNDIKNGSSSCSS